MGQEAPAGSESDDSQGTVVYRKVLAKNSGVCVEDSTGVCLNLGSGKTKWDNWINVDLESGDVKCDIRDLDFPDEHADAIAAIHVIEHFHQWEALPLLKEWKRVLKPGGKIILELPCMDHVFSYISNCMRFDIPLSPAFSTFAFWGDPKYRSVEMCHKWGYTIESIQALLREAGFTGIRNEEARYHFPQRDMRVVGYK